METKNAIYAPPEAPLTEHRTGTLLSPQAEADFRAAAKWIKRTILAGLAVTLLRAGFMVCTGWQWTLLSWVKATLTFVGAAVGLAGFFVPLPPLRRSVRTAESPGDVDDAVMQCIRDQRLCWKRLFLCYFIIICLMLIGMLTGLGFMR